MESKRLSARMKEECGVKRTIEAFEEHCRNFSIKNHYNATIL
jgi:hypothetical protein